MRLESFSRASLGSPSHQRFLAQEGLVPPDFEPDRPALCRSLRLALAPERVSCSGRCAFRSRPLYASAPARAPFFFAQFFPSQRCPHLLPATPSAVFAPADPGAYVDWRLRPASRPGSGPRQAFLFFIARPLELRILFQQSVGAQLDISLRFAIRRIFSAAAVTPLKRGRKFPPA